MTIKFSKFVATGNDFVVIDNRAPQIASRIPQIVQKLCDRRFGIGADGLLLLEKSNKADFKMRIFNPDGSEAEMCGNGSRCIAVFAYKSKIAKSSMAIETKAGLLKAHVNSGLVKINMTEPNSIKLGIDLETNSGTCQVNFINTGVPHAVIFVDDIENVDVADTGSDIRFHKVFLPAGTNVDFVKRAPRGTIFIRTYERGVEAETLACGTGAAASAIISSIIKGNASPVKVVTRGGDLNIYFHKKNDRFSKIFLEGEAAEVFSGKTSYE